MAADEATDEEVLQLEAPKAGLAFRAEMWVMDFLLGYWPALLGAIGVSLLVVLFYGLYSNMYRDDQRRASQEIARVEAKLTAADRFDLGALGIGEEDAMGLSRIERLHLASVAASMGAGASPVSPDDLVAAGTQLEAVQATGAARAEALLKAAELYRIAGRPDDARRALDAAVADGAGLPRALALSALANLDLDAGDDESGIKRLDALSLQKEGVISQQATLDLGIVYERLERKADASAVYDRFLATWPDSPRAAEARQRKEQLGAE